MTRRPSTPSSRLGLAARPSTAQLRDAIEQEQARRSPAVTFLVELRSRDGSPVTLSDEELRAAVGSLAKALSAGADADPSAPAGHAVAFVRSGIEDITTGAIKATTVYAVAPTARTVATTAAHRTAGRASRAPLARDDRVLLRR